MTFDATQVTGSPQAGAGARPGDVLAERYELLEAFDLEGPSIGYRALDQETERTVLVRTLVGPPLASAALAEMMERLRGLVGAGGRHLSPLRDTDREGRRPFTVEAWPEGTALSSILHGRRERGEPLSPREVLPIAAHLAAALAAIPPGWHHGDVRAERVFVHADGLRLTGGFLVAALPGRLLAERMASIGPAAVAYAPECMAGRAGAPADRWGAAALIWEALTLRAPDRTSAPRELSPGVLTALRRLLDPEPGRRPADLSALLEALARQAGVPVPNVDPGVLVARAGVGASPVDGAFASGADDTQEQPALPGPGDSTEDALDPRLVRAALGVTMDGVERGVPPLDGDPGLDPRLVRAALGVVIEESPEGAASELVSDEEELALDEVEEAAPAPAPPQRTGPQPAARPAHRPAAAAPVSAAPTPRAAQAASSDAPAHRAAQGDDGGTAVIPRPPEPEPMPSPAPARRRAGGALILAGAVFLAALIIGAGFVVRAMLTRERSAAERSRQMQERIEQIRGGGRE